MLRIHPPAEWGLVSRPTSRNPAIAAGKILSHITLVGAKRNATQRNRTTETEDNAIRIQSTPGSPIATSPLMRFKAIPAIKASTKGFILLAPFRPKGLMCAVYHGLYTLSTPFFILSLADKR
ncbi:hypothetical protein LCGC14_1884320 [marine sediment metagenome]|uniref:Uncharacterized protein n=1 Tax=marine sediment metagenome TaxID=412755 RepID=A0A0F9IZM2_9ZZZZ